VRHFILTLLLCGIFLFFPFQVYIIGNDNGIGIQGATFRYQISGYGNSLIPITNDVLYVIHGMYTGRTALSIIVWFLGTLLLVSTTLFSLIFSTDSRVDFFHQIGIGLLVVCGCYLISCIAQYGWFFAGPAGISIPFGIVILLSWIVIVYKYPELFNIKTQILS